MITQHVSITKTAAPACAQTIVQAQERIIEEFGLLDDWNDRYQNLIECGRRLAPMRDTLRVERNRIQNCHGDAWLAAEDRDGLLQLSAASETGVVAGLLAIVVDVYSGHSPADVLDHPLTVLDSIGLTNRLSPHRLAAFREIVGRLRVLALQANDGTTGRPSRHRIT